MKSTWYLPILMSLASTCVAADEWTFQQYPVSTKYAVYGRSLDDPMVPSKSDKKIAFEVSGEAAREIFDVIGPDKMDTCADNPGERLRTRDHITCTKSAKGKHTCYFGFDLKSGKSIAGSIC